MKPDIHTERGFSLLEVLIALAVFAMLTVGAFTLWASSNRLYFRGQSRADAQQNARTAIEATSREIRMAGYDPSGVIEGLTSAAPIQTANANSITFVADVTGDATLDQVSYQLSGTTLTRSQSSWNGTSFPAAVTGEVADGLSQLVFSYFDASDAAIAAPVASGSLDDIERVTISLRTSQTTVGEQQTCPLVEDAKIRN